MLDCLHQFLFGPALGLQPSVLHKAPHRLDVVELRAEGREELELDALLLQQLECRPDGRCVVDLGVVEHDDQRLADLLGQVGQEA